MAYIQEKVKGKKIVSFKFKACMGRDANGKQIFKCKTWYPPADLTPAKSRKEAQKVAGVWEEDAKQAYNVLNLIFGFAEKQDIIQKNPMKKVDLPKVSKREVAALTEDEAVRFFNKHPKSTKRRLLGFRFRGMLSSERMRYL